MFFYIHTLLMDISILIHARIAILEGLNPKENREIPTLRYEEGYRLKEDFPHLRLKSMGV